MTDKLKPGSKAFWARQERWRHNSFLGHVKMMQQNCRSIAESSTATTEAKSLARRIYALAEQLSPALKIRIDK